MKVEITKIDEHEFDIEFEISIEDLGGWEEEQQIKKTLFDGLYQHIGDVDDTYDIAVT